MTAKEIDTRGRNQRARMGSNVTISIIGAAVILILVNYLSMRHYTRSDWTSAGIYTLSDKSEKVIKSLQKDVMMFVLWSQADPRFPDVKEILDRYVAVSPKLKLEVLDQDLNPEKVQLIIEKYGAKMRDMGEGMMAVEASIIIVSGDNVKFVSSSDFEDLGNDMLEPGQAPKDELSGFKAEQALTSAILSVTSGKQSKICFTQGHNEWGFEGFGGRSLGFIKEGLIQDGLKAGAITTLGANRIQADCELVIVVGPKKAFLEEEAKLFETYLEQGGRLMLLLDPNTEGERFSPTGLERLTARYGIKLSRDLIIETDARRLVSPSPFTFTASEFTAHDSVAQLVVPDSVGEEVKSQISAFPVVFSTVRSLLLREDHEGIVDILAKSSQDSWGEVDLASMGTGGSVPTKDQYDTNGPAAIAMVASLPNPGPDKEGGRLVVVGDSDFLGENLFVNAGLNNRDFWSGLVGWLTQRGDLISIAAKNPEHIRLNLTDDDVLTIWQLVGGEVIFFILLGVIVWMRRRS